MRMLLHFYSNMEFLILHYYTQVSRWPIMTSPSQFIWSPAHNQIEIPHPNRTPRSLLTHSVYFGSLVLSLLEAHLNNSIESALELKRLRKKKMMIRLRVIHSIVRTRQLNKATQKQNWNALFVHLAFLFPVPSTGSAYATWIIFQSSLFIHTLVHLLFLIFAQFQITTLDSKFMRVDSREPLLCAVWTERNGVLVYNLQALLSAVDEPEPLTSQSSVTGRKQARKDATPGAVAVADHNGSPQQSSALDSKPLYRFKGHGGEGFALAWSTTVPGSRSHTLVPYFHFHC